MRDALPPVWPGAPLCFHDLKHTAKAIMNNLRIHPVMQDYRLGHTTPGTQGVYSHPTEEMRTELINALQTFWETWLAGGLQEPWAAHWRALTASSPKILPSGPPSHHQHMDPSTSPQATGTPPGAGVSYDA